MERDSKYTTRNDADYIRVGKDTALQTMLQLIEQANHEVSKFYKIAVENQNTRKDIRECAHILRDLMGQMSASDLTKAVQTTDAENKPPEKKEATTQTEPSNQYARKDRITAELITAARDYEDFVRIKNANWPQEVFTKSSHIDGIITQAGKDEDVLIWDEGEEDTPQTKRALMKYPELEEKKGEYAQMSLTMRMRDAEGTESLKEQVITKMVTDSTERHCYNQLKAMMAEMVRNGREALAIYPPRGDGNGDTVRKMAECIFATTKIHCKVYYTATTRGANKTGERKGKGKEETEAVLVNKIDGKSYAELLRVVKDGMKGKEEMTRGIKNIRQTKGGDILITTKKGKASAAEIKKVLDETAGVSTKVNKNEAGRDGVIIFVKGMDAVTTKAEVREALIEAGGMKAEPKIGELRPYYGSSLAVTAKLPEEAAEKVLKKRELRIGYNWCRVTKRVEITQCYRCWLYGHKAAECKNAEDRSKNCRNCGDQGHLQKECTLQKYCPVCKRQGHCAGTGGCPSTRQALRKARSEEYRKEEQGTEWVNLKAHLSTNPK